MKILLATNNYGENWKYSTMLARQMRKHEISITLAIIGTELSSQHKKDLEGVAYFNLVARQEWMDSPWEDLRIAKEWLGKLKMIIQPDILHLNIFGLGKFDWNMPVLLNIDTLAFFRWKALISKQKFSDWQRYEKTIRQSIDSANMVIGRSEEIILAAEKVFGSFRNKRIIYRGREKSLFKDKRLINAHGSPAINSEDFSRAGTIENYRKLYHDVRRFESHLMVLPVFSN